MVQLQVHLVQRLLHMLNVNRSHLNKAISMSYDRPHCAHRLVWSKRWFQKTNRVQILNPLAVNDIAFPAWNIPNMSSIDHENVETTLLQNLEERYPVNSSGLHRDRVNAAGLEPVCSRQQVIGECKETANGLRISFCWDGDIDFIGAPISIPAAFGWIM